MSETTEARFDDGGALIEYVGGTDRYFVVLLLDGVEIARRGPYRDRGDDLMVKFAEERAKAEARMARLRTTATNAYQAVGRRNFTRNRPVPTPLPTATKSSSKPAYLPPLYPPVGR